MGGILPSITITLRLVGLTLNYTLSSSTSIVFNGIDGFEQPYLAPYGKKDVADFIITETVNDNLSLCLNADYGQERVGNFLEYMEGD